MAARIYDYLFKVLLIGDSGVGKSSIMLRFSEDAFNETFLATIGIDFKIRTLNLNGIKVKLQVWDTAGQERFHSITAHYFRGAMGIMLVYDISDPASFNNIKKWMSCIQKEDGFNGHIMIIGNKCDMADNREISKGRGEVVANEYGAQFLETSARNNINIDEAFINLSKIILDNIPTNQEIQQNVTTLGQQNRQYKRCCNQ